MASSQWQHSACLALNYGSIAWGIANDERVNIDIVDIDIDDIDIMEGVSTVQLSKLSVHVPT